MSGPRLGPDWVEDGAESNWEVTLKDTRTEVRLDDAGQDVHGRALGGEDQVDPAARAIWVAG